VIDSIISSTDDNYFNQAGEISINHRNCKFIEDIKDLKLRLPSSILIYLLIKVSSPHINSFHQYFQKEKNRYRLSEDKINKLFNELLPYSGVKLHGDIITQDPIQYIIETTYGVTSVGSNYELIPFCDNIKAKFICTPLVKSSYLNRLVMRNDIYFHTKYFKESFKYVISKEIFSFNHKILNGECGADIRYSILFKKLKLTMTEDLLDIGLDHLFDPKHSSDDGTIDEPEYITDAIFYLIPPENMKKWDTSILIKFMIKYVNKRCWVKIMVKLGMDKSFIIDRILPIIKNECEGNNISEDMSFKKSLVYFIETIVHFKTQIRSKRSKIESYSFIGISLASINRTNNIHEIYEFIQLNLDQLV